ncbi:MAG: sporulation transcription factor Spo0A [Bacillota bacterium]
MDNINVLVVDSDSFVVSECRRVFCGKVRMFGHAEDGETALRMIENGGFDVLLIDIALSKIDGLTILERISKAPRSFKIVVMSAMNSSFVIEKSMQYGASYFLTKPVSCEILPELIKRIFEDGKIDNPSLLSKSTSSKNLDEKIANIFMTIGIPPHIRGYSYLREAIKLAVAKPVIISSITKELYPSVAEIMSSSPSKVERAIRHAIDVAWTRGKSDKLGQILGVKVYVSMKPTNGEFIALIADKLLLESI